ncbi:MAG: hypothetical protein IMZ50_04045 [Candidatus Atribacteria bacterium]|nr:hypothetical protein [Candidatus Atribacteria bacterium]
MRRRYRENAPAIAHKDHWRLACEVPGVGFKTADEIAARLGFSADAPGRIRAGIVHCIRERAEEGDACLPSHPAFRARSQLHYGREGRGSGRGKAF